MKRNEVASAAYAQSQRIKSIRRYFKVDDATAILLDKAHRSNETCDCCGDDSKVFHIDHDHETHKVRGILCSRCNMGLGHFGDSIERLEQAIIYLKSDRKVL